MKRSTRWIGLVWLALVLNVLSPVIGYARVASAHGPLPVELCHALGAHHVDIGMGADEDASKTHPVVAHCVYCPGFAANFALGASLPAVSAPVRAFISVRTFEPQSALVRRSVRVAQPRAPPETLI
ncbi:MAG TPA: DUF2946 domain-containing protein [Paraburkholderia sp.]|jgi:hypothetical protein